MSKSFIPAIATAVALAIGGVAVSTVSTPVHAGQAGPTVSAELAKTLKAANDAAQAKKWPETIKSAQEALANPKKTPYDTLVAYQFLAVAYNSTGNQAELLKALQGQLDTGQLSAPQAAEIQKAVVAAYYQQKNFDKAIELGQLFIRGGNNDPAIGTVVGQSLYQKNQFGEAAKFFANMVSEQEKRGQAPRENLLTLLRASYNKAGNKAAENDALEKMVVYYPKPEYWDALLYSLRNDPKLNERQTMLVYRLMDATKTLKRAVDYTDYADMALNAGLFGESARVLESGIAGKVFTQDSDKSRADRLLASAKRQGDSDKANLTKLETEAKASASGDLDVALGYSLLSYGDNAKAVEALGRGLTKGKLRNPEEAQIVLGIAQLRAGNKAEAVKTLRAVKSADPLTERIANLWELYAK